MEIKLKNVSCEQLNQLNLTLEEGKLLAVTGDYKEAFFQVLMLTTKVTGTLLVDGTRLLLKKQSAYKNQIYLIPADFLLPLNSSTVIEYLRLMMREYQIICQDEEKKMKDAIRLVGLKNEILYENLLSLSQTEKKFLQIAVALIINPKVFLFENPLCYFDFKNKKKCIRIFTKLKEHYRKTILFTTDSCEEIYQYADEVIILKDHLVLASGEVEDVYSQGQFLQKYGISLPKAIAFSDFVKAKKDIHLDYYKDIRDLIKDIYRKKK